MAPESFPRRVYAIVACVPAGRVITYGVIARLLGDPRKARQVGWAMAATPEELDATIPAHRVINARGEVSGGHAALRRAKLEAEGVAFTSDGRIDLDEYLWLPAETSGQGPAGDSDSVADAPAGKQAGDSDQDDRADHRHDQ
jgi:methylated-DNA-protein-cysteine methyltransferase-like protein